MADDVYAGPLNFTVFAIPANADLSTMTAEIQRLEASHSAEILDVERIVVDGDGYARREPFGAAARALLGAETDLLPDDTLAIVGKELRQGEEALVVIYEDRTLARLAAASAQLHGREALMGGIDPEDLTKLIGGN